MKRTLVLTLSGLALAGFLISRGTRRTFSFAGKVVLITGGSRGLGLVLARQLSAEGARVALIARDPDELRRAREKLVLGGGEVLTISCDLLRRDQIDAAVREVVGHFGGLDVLINNAGILVFGPLEHMQRDDFERALNLHFWAPFNLIMTAIPHLRRRGGGRIVNIASIGGKIAVPHLAPYCASKFALVGLSDALRAELARDRIQVTTVTPGMMQTGSQGNALFKGDHRAEYAWFSLSAGLPFSSVKAGDAATRIISACRCGSPSLTIPFIAHTAILSNALFPNITGRIMKMINKVLPPPSGPDGGTARSGWTLSQEE